MYVELVSKKSIPHCMFHRVKQAIGGFILSSNKFLKLPQLAQKIELASKVVKIDSKEIILLP
jgi:hypothetical protein